MLAPIDVISVLPGSNGSTTASVVFHWKGCDRENQNWGINTRRSPQEEQTKQLMSDQIYISDTATEENSSRGTPRWVVDFCCCCLRLTKPSRSPLSIPSTVRTGPTFFGARNKELVNVWCFRTVGELASAPLPLSPSSSTIKTWSRGQPVGTTCVDRSERRNKG